MLQHYGPPGRSDGYGFASLWSCSTELNLTKSTRCSLVGQSKEELENESN
jgi:hypothetical protein